MVFLWPMNAMMILGRSYDDAQEAAASNVFSEYVRNRVKRFIVLELHPVDVDRRFQKSARFIRFLSQWPRFGSTISDYLINYPSQPSGLHAS
jgi:hypothetical protein